MAASEKARRKTFNVSKTRFQSSALGLFAFELFAYVNGETSFHCLAIPVVYRQISVENLISLVADRWEAQRSLAVLQWLVHNEHPDIFYHFITCIKDPHLQSQVFPACLSYAFCSNDLETANYIISTGTDPFPATYYGLFCATHNGWLDMARYLVSVGANVHVLGEEALGIASSHGNLEIVNYFVSLDADIHARDDYALRLASYHGQLETVKYLVSCGANVHAVTDYAFKSASANGHLETVKYLVAIGANIQRSGSIALQWAHQAGHSRVVEYLYSLGCRRSILSYVVPTVNSYKFHFLVIGLLMYSINY